MVEEAQIILHEADKPDLVVDLLDADFLTGEDRAEVYLLPSEADAAAVCDGDGLVVEGVLEVRESAIGSCRGPVELGGVPHAKSLVGPFVVVTADECIELGLLLEKVAGSWLGGFFLERQVHAFMTAVLLGMPRFDALDANAEAEPPHRQLAQSEQSVGTCERNAVIGTDGVGQSKILESAFEDGKGIDLLGGREGIAGDEIATGEVADRERVAVASIGEHELALVIRAPQLVRPAGS